MNPKKLGGLANHKQEPWKLPLPEFIEVLYERRFGRRRPERVVSIEKRTGELTREKLLRRQERARGSVGEQARARGAAIVEAADHE